MAAVIWFTLQPDDRIPTKIKQGEIIHVVIDAYDMYGEKRHIGGDFFCGVMYNTKLNKRTSGKVVDFRNGTYSAYFYAGWHGYANITITLWHTREAKRWIDTVYRPNEHHVDWLGHFKMGDRLEKSLCHVIRDGVWKNKCEYRNEHALGNTVFICDRPATLPCDSLHVVYSVRQSLGEHVDDVLQPEQKFMFERPYLATDVFGSPMGVHIEGNCNSKGNKDVLNSRPPCQPRLPVYVESNGWWDDHTSWTSLVCRTSHWTNDTIPECLTNKTVYLLGDSTLRQWHECLTVMMQQNVTNNSTNRFFSDTRYNITLEFIFHAIMIGSHVVNFRDQHFETDVIDSIQQCNVVIVLSLSYHFATWSKESYLERLLCVQRAIQRLQLRCPGVDVIVKSSHPRDHNTVQSHIHSSDWTLFNMNRISREIFERIGVGFIDVWDMSQSHVAQNNVHMPIESVIRQQIDIFLSFICSKSH
ncbi:NXPE family member 4-like [Saccoglossus kowalevskii]